jgi:gamma-glutamylputrescine oxidase
MSADPQTSGHAPTWYAATAIGLERWPELQGETSADVCVIGAGFTGISAALELAEHGYTVIVLESVRVGFGASGRNGGQIVNGYSRDLATIARWYGAERAAHLAAMSLEGAQIIRERVKKYAINCDLVDGGVFAAFTQKQMRELVLHCEHWKAFGHDGLEVLSRRDLDGVVHSDRYIGGILDRHGGHIHPLNLVLGQAAAVTRLGGRIFESSQAVSVDIGPKTKVHTDRGTVSARYILVCGNAYLGALLPALTNCIMPVSSQIIATEPLEPSSIRALLPANYCVEDSNYVLDYYRRTSDNRLLYGGGVGYGGSDPRDIIRTIRPKMLRTFPELGKVRIDYAWSGNFALTLTRIPHIGKLADNVYFSHGDSGHGVTTTHLLGKILGEAVAGHAERFDIWSSLKNFPFPGGRIFRVPLTSLGAWWYGLRDRLGI